VPFHIAFGMTAEEAATFRAADADLEAWSIVLSEFEGARFDWNTMRFAK
jgi:hypothetical protein